EHQGIEIPFILSGREYRSADSSENEGIVLEYKQGGTAVRFPTLEISDAGELFSAEKELTKLSTGEILDFLSAVGKLWSDPGYVRYQDSLELMKRITDFSEEELVLDFSYIPALLERGGYLEEMLRAEFGDPGVLDQWTLRGGCEVKAIPRGRLLHVLAGNVPGVELISLARGLMTKNANVLKMARGNPITPVALVSSFADIDPDHPITRSTSVIYWERGSAAETEIFRGVQSVCVWGGFDAVNASWSHARPGLEILDYGPKRSMVFIGASTMSSGDSLTVAAAALASDTVIHDQQACHSPQVVFVEGGEAARGRAELFASALGRALDEAGKSLPRGEDTIDRKAQVGHMRNMAELMGEEVFHPGSTAWTLIVTNDFTRTATNPLGRTLWILPVDSVSEAVNHADSWTMVAAFSLRADLEAHRDFLAARGVDRLTILGNMGLLPPGTPHEGRYDLTRMVKFVSADLTPEPMPAGRAAADRSEVIPEQMPGSFLAALR
ncbi:MAG: hypothetical protein KAJ98_01660, partial [Spirochaetaceae bacterium]|nr:hypothetical protein [Spirochaetaceae bacterium]